MKHDTKKFKSKIDRLNKVVYQFCFALKLQTNFVFLDEKNIRSGEKFRFWNTIFLHILFLVHICSKLSLDKWYLCIKLLKRKNIHFSNWFSLLYFARSIWIRKHLDFELVEWLKDHFFSLVFFSDEMFRYILVFSVFFYYYYLDLSDWVIPSLALAPLLPHSILLCCVDYLEWLNPICRILLVWFAIIYNRKLYT